MVRGYGHDDTRKGIDGSLSDVSVCKLLDTCREHRITGALRIMSWGRPGVIQMRAGRIEQAFFGTFHGDDAVNELMSLRDGLFDVLQELPDLSKAPSPSPGRTLLSALLQQCRERALSCDIVLIRDRERAELCCRGGVIVHTRINGVRHAGEPRELRRFEHACARVDAVPLTLHGNAATGRASTEPGSARPSRRPSRRKPAVVLQAEALQPPAMPAPACAPASAPRPAQPAAAQPAPSSPWSPWSGQVPRVPQLAQPMARLATNASWYNPAPPTEIVAGGRGFPLADPRDRTATMLVALAFLMVLVATLIASGL